MTHNAFRDQTHILNIQTSNPPPNDQKQVRKKNVRRRLDLPPSIDVGLKLGAQIEPLGIDVYLPPTNSITPPAQESEGGLDPDQQATQLADNFSRHYSELNNQSQEEYSCELLQEHQVLTPRRDEDKMEDLGSPNLSHYLTSPPATKPATVPATMSSPVHYSASDSEAEDVQDHIPVQSRGPLAPPIAVDIADITKRLLRQWQNSGGLSSVAFASLPVQERLAFLNLIERNYRVLSADGKLVYDDNYLNNLYAAQSMPSIYMEHLRPNSHAVATAEDFPKDFTEGISWMTSPSNLYPTPYLTDEKDTKFCVDTDIDFTGFVTQSLLFLQSSINLVFCPNLSPTAQLKSCKMDWKHNTLHTKCNTLLGSVEEKYDIHVVFPEHSKYGSSGVINHFFENVIHKGILASIQGKVTLASTDYRSVIRVKKAGSGGRVLVETLTVIDQHLRNYIRQYPKNKPVFVIQYYGGKEPKKSPDEIRKFYEDLDELFAMDMVYHHTEGAETMFYQDVAMDIRCTDTTNVTVFWQHAIYKQLLNPHDSPLARIMTRNSTVFCKERARDNGNDYERASVSYYPNYGLGVFCSMIAEWNRQHLLVSKIKAYQRGSEQFRHDAPFSNCWHAALSFPVKQASRILGTSLGTKLGWIVEKLKKEKQLVKEQAHYKNAMIYCKQLMPEKAYGPRLEVTLQNPTCEDLVDTFVTLTQFGHAAMTTFNTLKAARQLNEVPAEFLRVSPLQAVATSITCLFIEKTTTSLALLLYRLLCKMGVESVIYNEHWTRLAFLLQDLLTFLWTGSIQGLVHPGLFARFQMKEAVFKHGRYYISPQLLRGVGAGMKLRDLELHVPIPPHHQELDDTALALEPPDRLRVIGLPQTLIKAIFENPSDVTEVATAMEQVTLCFANCGGIVHPPTNSLSCVIAANLLNGLFGSIFNAAKLRSANEDEFMLALKSGSQQKLSQLLLQACPGASVNFANGYLSTDDFVDFAFPVEANKLLFTSAPIAVPFLKQWHAYCPQIIERMDKVLTMPESKRETVPLLKVDSDGLEQVITQDEIKAKMKLLLKGLRLKMLPLLSTSRFWGYSTQQNGPIRFLFVEVQGAVAYEANAESTTCIFLPNSQKGSLVLSSEDLKFIDAEMKIKVLRYRIYNSDVFKGVNGKNEIYKFCSFHVLKKNPNEFCKYKNVRKGDAFKTGLFKETAKREAMIPVDDEIWMVYYTKHILQNDAAFTYVE